MKTNISIIISTYNSPDWLAKVLYGYNTQTYRNFEMVIADDGSNEKTKELIAVAIAVAIRCDGGIGFHVKALVRLGATREELNEVLNMCVYLGGGPSLMYAANVLAAFDEFSVAS